MKVCTSHSNYTGKKSGVLTFGIFDGLHLGHQKIIQRVVSQAKKKHSPSILMTFDPHPLQLLQPDRGVGRLFPLEDLIQQADGFGLEYLVIEEFSQSFSQQTALDFFEQCIYQPFRPSRLIVGYDLKFGCNRGGSFQSLKNWADQYLFEVEEVSPFKTKGEIASTSLLREAFSVNDFEKMSAVMGRPFSIWGSLVSGDGRGKLLGFPTLNIQTNSLLPKKRGVYICLLHWNHNVFPGVMNIGVNPTFSDGHQELKVEVHLTESCPQNFQSKDVRVDILMFIRDEKKFDSIDSLKKAVQLDSAQAKDYFKRMKKT